MRSVNPKVAVIVAAVLGLLLIFYVFAGDGGYSENPDRLRDDQVAGIREPAPQARCGAQQTYDLVKRELFRRAAEVRGADQAAFERIASHSVLRVDSPRLVGQDDGSGAIRCAGTLTLDLAPGLTVVGGRRSLSAESGYAMQPAGAGGADIWTLTNAEAIVQPLATLSRAGSSAGAPVSSATTDGEPQPATDTDRGEEPAPNQAARTADPSPAPRPASPRATSPPARAASTQPPRATASPSFNCRNARTRGEIAVCNDAGLASLDRQMAGQFNRAMSQATPAQRTLLQRTRGSFLRYRDSCGSAACMAGAYRDRMREIGDIMTGRWQPN